MTIESLTQAQCILLTVHYAVEANIQALHSFTPLRLDVLDPDLVLRILLTYLPETLEPRAYITYAEEVASRLYLDVTREDIQVDTTPVKDIDDAQARKKVKKLHLLEIRPPAYPPHAPNDLFTLFLCHRAYRIDSETGALNLVPQLVEPYLERNSFIRTWYISFVLPLLRLNYEYYPSDASSVALERFEKMDGKECIDLLLEKATSTYKAATSPGEQGKSMISRDMKGLVGAWMYGHTERQRRRAQAGKSGDKQEEEDAVDAVTDRVHKINLSGVSQADKTGHDWENVFSWMVDQSRDHFTLITQLIDDWDGPADVDVGGLDKGHRFYLDHDIQQKLGAQYAQAVFASCYAAQADSEATTRGAHGVLARLAELLDFVPPPDLATSVDSLPRIERHATMLNESQSSKDLEGPALLKPEHPLTTPRMDSYMLLQMMVYSAYQFIGLGRNMSIVHVARLHFYSSAAEQLQLLQSILNGLTKFGRQDDAHWQAHRSRLIWLWNWGIEGDDLKSPDGAGPLGKIDESIFQQELLKVFVDANSAQDLNPAENVDVLKEEQSFPFTVTEEDRAPAITHSSPVVIARGTRCYRRQSIEAYDGASNGNKTRGGVKKANDILSGFRSQFPQSTRITEIAALISATHALSFYSLTLQRGAPFQPVSIRVTKDPIELISKVLEQNPRSYAKLDDLVGIAENLASAGLQQDTDDDMNENDPTLRSDTKQQRRTAARRVTLMAVEAALREDDFETAYSYIVNRLTPSTADISAPPQNHKRNVSTGSALSRTQPMEDDISWRAAYLAGRYRPSSASPPTLRRLEQRTELLSLALLLAPSNSLTDILSAWRRCEEETSALHLAQQQEEQAFDDHADRKESSALPGNFTLSGDEPQLMLNQKRREMGRIANLRGEGEAPMSMYDLTRSAACAFSRNVNLGQSRQEPLERSTESLQSGQIPEDAGSKVRRRDMVANAVSGGLASGIGWVLGAKPAEQQ